MGFGDLLLKKNGIKKIVREARLAPNSYQNAAHNTYTLA